MNAQFCCQNGCQFQTSGLRAITKTRIISDPKNISYKPAGTSKSLIYPGNQSYSIYTAPDQNFKPGGISHASTTKSPSQVPSSNLPSSSYAQPSSGRHRSNSPESPRRTEPNGPILPCEIGPCTRGMRWIRTELDSHWKQSPCRHPRTCRLLVGSAGGSAS